MIQKIFLDIPAYLALLPVIYSISKASYLDYKYRTVPIKTWYPAIVGALVSILVFSAKVYPGWINTYWAMLFLMSAAILIIIVLAASWFGAFGGADAIAIGVMTLAGFHITFHEFFAIAFVKNICVVSCLMILIFFILNIKDGNLFDKHKKLAYLFLARKKFPSKFNNSFGVVLQNPDESLAKTFNTTNYEESKYYSNTMDISLYKQEVKYWVLYSIPFIIPISIAFIVTILIGDFMKYL